MAAGDCVMVSRFQRPIEMSDISSLHPLEGGARGSLREEYCSSASIVFRWVPVALIMHATN